MCDPRFLWPGLQGPACTCVLSQALPDQALWPLSTVPSQPPRERPGPCPSLRRGCHLLVGAPHAALSMAAPQRLTGSSSGSPTLDGVSLLGWWPAHGVRGQGCWRPTLRTEHLPVGCRYVQPLCTCYSHPEPGTQSERWCARGHLSAGDRHQLPLFSRMLGSGLRG